MVVEVATGMHESGGCTVCWGLTYLDGRRIGKQDVEKALADAGFDFLRDSSIHEPELSDRRFRCPLVRHRGHIDRCFGM